MQVHGGMGFIEETGAAQYYRDARILPIYEGTTAIQANDLIGRKTLRDGGKVAKALLAGIDATVEALASQQGAAFDSMKKYLAQGHDSLSAAVDFVLANTKSDPNAVFAGSVPYLKLAGIVLGGWQMARALLVAAQKRDDDPSFYGAKIATAQFYAEHVLPQASALEASIVSGEGRRERAGVVGRSVLMRRSGASAGPKTGGARGRLRTRTHEAIRLMPCSRARPRGAPKWPGIDALIVKRLVAQGVAAQLHDEAGRVGLKPKLASGRRRKCTEADPLVDS